MADPQPAFDRVGNQFIDYYDTPRGYVREHLTRQQLELVIGQVGSEGTMQVADVGGGDGRDSIWAARRGAEALLVDPSSEMLTKAKEAVMFQPKEVRDRIKIEQGDAHSLAVQVPAGFDLVLSHGVLMYDLDNPDGHVQDLVSLLNGDGYLSLLKKGNGGAVKRLKDKKDFDGLKILYKTSQTTNNLDQQVWAFTEDQLHEKIEAAGGRVLDWFGVRALTEDRRDSLTNYSQSQLDQFLD